MSSIQINGANRNGHVGPTALIQSAGQSAQSTDCANITAAVDGRSPTIATTLNLNEHHLADLARSGLTEETIRRNGIRTVEDHRELAAMLNQQWSRKFGGAIVFPYFDKAETVVLNRVKPDNPPQRNGKLAKYLQPTGMPPRAYFPAGVRDALTDRDQAIVIAEGEKKALASTQAGYPCIGLTGVDCWHTKKSSALIGDLEGIDWDQRRVYICFDSDGAINPNVRENEVLLAAVLAKRGATVKVVHLEPTPNGQKVGLDDYLAAHGPHEFAELLSSADNPDPPGATVLKTPANEVDPATEAGRYLALQTMDGLSLLRFWKGMYLRYRDGAYRELTRDEVRAAIILHANSTLHHLSSRTVGDLLDQVKAQSILSSQVEAPAWIDGPKLWPPQEILVARNGLIHLPSLVSSADYLHAPTPRFFTTSALDYNFDANATEPTIWLDFLNRLWPLDPQSIALLQEWMGYLLTLDTSQHKILMILGPTRSGKGTIARVIQALIGKQNIAGPTLSSLTTNFGLAPLLGKSVAIISDARLSGRQDSNIVVERLLSISGEDALTIDRKNLDPVTTNLPVRFMILTNELPRLSDASSALAGRMMLLRLVNSWFGCEDTTLFDRLLGELPGILLWAIEGWRRLRERGYFVEPASAADTRSDLNALTSPIREFIADRCECGPEHSVPCMVLYEGYRDWCEAIGRAHAGDNAGFGRQLRAALPSLRVVRPRVGDAQIRHYIGLKLKF